MYQSNESLDTLLSHLGFDNNIRFLELALSPQFLVQFKVVSEGWRFFNRQSKRWNLGAFEWLTEVLDCDSGNIPINPEDIPSDLTQMMIKHMFTGGSGDVEARNAFFGCLLYRANESCT